ncbi:MAG: hypothetical protein IPK05_03150 [Comamonadaceae bacterium]|nr:hypothetical protein [Comamonadaceae bacterium]
MSIASAPETQPELERLVGELGALSTSLRRLSEQTTRSARPDFRAHTGA